MNATATSASASPTVALGAGPLTVDDVVELARGVARPVLAPAAVERMRASAAVVARLHEAGAPVYGVTTSVGASVTTAVPPERSAELSLNLLRMHGCGTGRLLGDEEAAAVLAARLCSLVAGKSGVRPAIAELMVAMLDKRVLPVIPSEGSVGASGDLTPLSYVAAVLVGEREARFGGVELPAAEALQRAGLQALELGPKEALALMNGTSVSSALACLALRRAEQIARVAATATAALSAAVEGNATHFDAFVHDAKPHAGQQRAAAWIREDLSYDVARPDHGVRLQDRYSIRCAPHVIGVLIDALAWGRQVIETELNGVSDNPVVDVDRGIVVHGGNFYGGHVAFVCDALKTAVANIACLADRQMALVCNPAENSGLPANLVGVRGPSACTHNGFKAVTIATSALAAEALKLTMPASAFSRSTELHNQDKVPMATLAARDLTRVVELTEQVLAMLVLAVCQACELRGGVTAPGPVALCVDVRARVSALDVDRRMDGDIAVVAEMIRTEQLRAGRRRNDAAS